MVEDDRSIGHRRRAVRFAVASLIGLLGSAPVAVGQSGSATANANANAGGASAAGTPSPAARPAAPATSAEGTGPGRIATPPALPSSAAPPEATPPAPSPAPTFAEAVPDVGDAATPGFFGGAATDAPARRRGFFEVARESISGPADGAPWEPLPLRTFFSEGWRDAWVASPNGSGGAPRQGWIGAADGNFYRLYWLSYIEAFNTTAAHNGYTSRFNLYTPLSRRLLLITTIPYLNANTPSFNLGTADFGNSGAAIRGVAQGTGTSFGDLTFTPRVMLAESQDFSLTAQVTVQIPTGSTRSGAGKAIITPGIQFWKDVGRGWVLRGAFNEGTGTNNPARGETLVSQLAIGQTVTPHDTPIFGDFTYYLAMNASNQITPTARTTVTLGPGYRTHLGNDWYSLGAIIIPVTGPQPFDESLTLWLMKTF